MVVHEQTIFGTSLGDREVVTRFARMIPLPVIKVECVFSAAVILVSARRRNYV